MSNNLELAQVAAAQNQKEVTINDQGAPPVLVNLRLRQAYDHLTKGDQ